MSATRRLERARARVSDELAANEFWHHVVADRFWICPYCGFVGATIEPGKDLAESVFHHLVDSCGGWAEFEGSYLRRDVISRRKTEVLTGWKLSHDPSWRFFDDVGRWFCPFCARPNLVRELRTEHGMAEAKRTIVEHLHGCPSFDGGRGRPLDHETLSREVRLETRVHRLAEQIRHRVEEDPGVWLRRTRGGVWICPFCFDRILGVHLRTELLIHETAPLEIARHLARGCVPYEHAPSVEGQPPHVLKALPPQPPESTFDADAADELCLPDGEPIYEPKVPIQAETKKPPRGLTI